MGSYGRHYLDDEDIQAVVDVLRNCDITQGKEIESFERMLSGYTNSNYCVVVSSGTAALQLSVSALGIKAGDEVITTPLTFCATANMVIQQGADIRFVDIDEKTLNIDPDAIEEKITEKTKAIMPVDFRGHPSNLPAIKKIANKHKLKVIEDASHSLGSQYSYQGRLYYCAGCAHADLATLSFHPVKHITTGEGGAILTNDEALYHKMKTMRSHGIERTTDIMNETPRVGEWMYDIRSLGYNYRLTDIQAALGKSQLNKIEQFKARRRQIVDYYNDRLSDIEELTLPYESIDVDSNFHIYVLRVNENSRFDRYDLFKALRSRNYQPMVHYIPIHLLSYYQSRYRLKRGDFPIAEGYYDAAITIPLYPSMADSYVEKVVSDIHECLEIM